MPRVLGGSHTMIIQDNLSNSEIHLQYRMPTSQEIISYRNGGTQRKRNKIIDRTGQNRLEHGLKILTGFREGDFEIFKDGKAAPISSDPKSGHHDPDWKKHIKKQASDLVETLAFQVFDGSSQVIAPETDEEDTESIEQD